MAKFRKKPIVVEAEQWFLGKLVDGVGIVRMRIRVGDKEHSDQYGCIETPKGVRRIEEGDWIITDADGKVSFCKPDIFEKTYEPVEAP